VPQLSILDGWWIEGYNGKNGWAITGAEGQDKDAKDAAAIYDLLEKEIVPLFYNVDKDGVSHGWIRTMKETIKMTGPNFCARRMVKDYTRMFYLKAIETSRSAELRTEKKGIKEDLFRRI
jgi:starch phosphorylase